MAASKTRTAKSEQERRARAEQLVNERKRRRQLVAVVLFALSVFLFALAFVEGQSGWQFMRKVLFGIFGIFGYGVGILLFLLALAVAYSKKISRIKTVSAVMLIFLICGAFLIFGNAAVFGTGFFEKLGNLYLTGTEISGGGIASAALGWPLMELLGHPGAEITVVLLIFVFFMISAGKSLLDVIEFAGKPIAAARKARAERELPEDLPAEITGKPAPALPANKRRSDIDIPLGSKNRGGMDVPLDDSARAPEYSEPPFEPTNAVSAAPQAAQDSPSAERQSPDVKKPETELVLDIFEQAEREENENREIFARFSSAAGSADSETERLVKRAARSSYESRDPGAADSAPKPSAPSPRFRLPPVSLLERESANRETDVSAELRANADFLVKTLESFGVQTKIVDISRGPAVTRYELQPNAGVRLSRITNLADDIALNFATAGVRIEAPIPNKAAVGIEVPNKQKRMVRLRSVIESEEFRNSGSPLTVALGRDISGKVMITDVAKMPHLLIAGTTGSGKSRCLHSMILSLIYKSPPEELRFVIIDPKMVEFGVYNGIPNMLIPVVTDARKAAGALGWAVGEMLKRYKSFSQYGVRDIASFNKMVEQGEYVLGTDDEGNDLDEPEKMPRIVVIIDELADLMMASPREVEDSICRLAQMARAAGLHLIIATQRPSVDVITGVIKANISSRIALSVSSQIDSRTIIDSAGAEKLIGNGDMLFLPLDLPKPVRIQGCFVSDEEIDRVIRDLKKNTAAEYNEQVLEEIERQAANEKSGGAGGPSDEGDSMLDDAIATVVEAGQASTSLLQRKLKLGYARAARIMDEMEQMGVVGPPDGSKPRAVNLSPQQWHEMRVNRDD